MVPAVGGFKPLDTHFVFEYHISQIGSFPQFGKNNISLKQPPRNMLKPIKPFWFVNMMLWCFHLVKNSTTSPSWFKPCFLTLALPCSDGMGAEKPNDSCPVLRLPIDFQVGAFAWKVGGFLGVCITLYRYTLQHVHSSFFVIIPIPTKDWSSSSNTRPVNQSAVSPLQVASGTLRTIVFFVDQMLLSNTVG